MRGKLNLILNNGNSMNAKELSKLDVVVRHLPPMLPKHYEELFGHLQPICIRKYEKGDVVLSFSSEDSARNVSINHLRHTCTALSVS